MTVAKKRKAEPDEAQLDKTIEATFPASDASSGNVIEVKATRPRDRKPAKIDRGTVERLAEEARRKLGEQ